MYDFIASLATLLFLMFCGAVSWLLLPVVIAIRYPLRRNSTGEAWGKLLSDLVAICLLASLTAQLTQDYQHRDGAFTRWYPYISGLLLLMFTLEASIDKRLEIMREASKWTEYPEFVPDLKFWKVVPVVVLPFFLFFLNIPDANVPFVYSGFSAALGWLFHLAYVGSVLQLVAVVSGACLILGSLNYAIIRARSLFASPEKQESPDGG